MMGRVLEIGCQNLQYRKLNYLCREKFQKKIKLNCINMAKGKGLKNYVVVLGGGGELIFTVVTRKGMDGIKNNDNKLRDVVYGQPHANLLK
jgi:hypothetical protein